MAGKEVPLPPEYLRTNFEPKELCWNCLQIAYSEGAHTAEWRSSLVMCIQRYRCGACFHWQHKVTETNTTGLDWFREFTGMDAPASTPQQVQFVPSTTESAPQPLMDEDYPTIIQGQVEEVYLTKEPYRLGDLLRLHYRHRSSTVHC